MHYRVLEHITVCHKEWSVEEIVSTREETIRMQGIMTVPIPARGML